MILLHSNVTGKGGFGGAFPEAYRLSHEGQSPADGSNESLEGPLFSLGHANVFLNPTTLILNLQTQQTPLSMQTLRNIKHLKLCS